LWEELIPGDFLYVPAGTPHRILPKEVSVMYRFKAMAAGLEAVAWYCDRCSSPLWRRVWDTAKQSPQAGYQAACTTFNADLGLRTCGRCHWVHPEIGMEGYRWAEIDNELRTEQ
jgi:3-hydroxyanthranilate 3,4-dioxygenase